MNSATEQYIHISIIMTSFVKYDSVAKGPILINHVLLQQKLCLYFTE